MSLRFFIAVAVLLFAWAPSAQAQSIVLWLDSNVPGDKPVQKANNLTGGGLHLAHVDLAFPPMPESKDDDERYETLRTAMAEGKGRWDEFEVELAIATELEGALFTIDVIRDRRDLQDITDARLFQGAAASKAFEPREFLDDERALPFRRQLPGMRVNNPWFQAMALDSNREFTKADVADGSAFPELQAQQRKIKKLTDGAIDLTEVPPGASIVVDGREVAAGELSYLVRPGVHYVHVIRNKRIGGRAKVDVAPGETVDLPMAVSSTELDQARSKVLSGTTTGIPKPVKKTIDTLMRAYPGPVFLAAVDHDSGKVVVLPYARDAVLVPQRLVTVVGAIEVGGGTVISNVFTNEVGSQSSVGAVHAGFQLEIGISYGAILMGSDVAFTPTKTTSYLAPGDGEENVQTRVLPAPYGGVGVYILRPTGRTPTLLIAGTYGWNYPAHMTVGGRIVFGIPLKDGTWFRVGGGVKTAGDAMPAWTDFLAGTEAPHLVGFGRIGFGTRF